MKPPGRCCVCPWLIAMASSRSGSHAAWVRRSSLSRRCRRHGCVWNAPGRRVALQRSDAYLFRIALSVAADRRDADRHRLALSEVEALRHIDDDEIDPERIAASPIRDRGMDPRPRGVAAALLSDFPRGPVGWASAQGDCGALRHLRPDGRIPHWSMSGPCNFRRFTIRLCSMRARPIRS